MNPNHRTLRSVLLTASLFAFALCLGCILTTPAHAQLAPDTAAPVLLPSAPDDGTQAAVAVVRALSGVLPTKWAGYLVALASVMGIVGMIAKPIMTAVEAYVKSTPSQTDDEFVAKAQHSTAFKTFAWLLDFFTRIKIGPQFTATPQGESDTKTAS